MKRFIYAVAVLLTAASCQEKRKTTDSIEKIPIEVSTPIVREVTLTREYPGFLESDITIDIVARVNGTLESKNYKAGSRVKKGELLFSIDPTTYKDAVTQAQANLKMAKANLDYSRNNYERMKAALESDAVSQIEFIKAETNVASAQADVSKAEAALSTARKELSYCYISAPYDGYISLPDYSTGNYIAGATSPVKLATLYKDDIMYAYFYVTGNEWLRQQYRIDEVGKEEYITFTLGDDKYFSRKAKMDYLSPDVNLTTGTLRVRARLENNDHFLKPGSYISIVLPYEKIDKGILITDASIGTDQLGKFIYVVNDSNIVEYRHIVTGNLVDDTLRVIREGLKAGEKYVSKALLKVRNGMEIIPIMGNR
ncbi:MAG: efflux RND transporter periplasmic adaptor subunit [Bacteroidaceae bacterium]|nr:efflux RND transporter periplasmic adaptor subunit [Bacteroidaceae bacterium]